MPALALPLRARRALGPPAGTATALGAVAACLLTVVGTMVARAGPHPGTAAERDLPLVVLLISLAGLAAGSTAAWAVREDHPHAAVGLAVATAAVALPVWAGWPWLPAAARSAALAAGPLAIAGLAQVALRWRAECGTPSRVIWAAATAASGVHLLGYDPFADPWCARTCAAVPTVLDGLLPTRATVTVSAVLAVLAAGVAATVVGTRAAGTPWPVRVAVAASVTALGATAVVRAAGWGDTMGAGLVLVLAPLTVATVAAGVGAVVGRTTRTRAAVDTLLDQLADPRAPGTGPGRLRDVHFGVPEEERWVDRTGAEVPAPEPGHRTVVLPDRASPAVRLLLAPGTDPAEVLAGLTPARRLALSNARLTAVARARLGELQASQRRAVARGDAERTRIERDVHDGAQQRLVSAMFHLSLAQSRVPPDQRAVLARAQEEVQLALARLRRTTRGPFPAVLAEEGLLPALDDLTRDADAPVRLDARGDLRVGAEVERAAYAVVACTLADLGPGGQGTTARIAVFRADGLLRIDVEIRPSPAFMTDPTEVADRVGAVGGAYDRTWHSGSVTVTAVIPCGS